MIEEEIIFYGHQNIQSLHTKTLEITKERDLTLKGDCIIGVSSNKACKDLSPLLQRRLKMDDSIISLQISVENQSFQFYARGNSHLSLLDDRDIVIRKSKFICPRTILIASDKASSDIPRNLITSLQEQETKGVLKIMVE